MSDRPVADGGVIGVPYRIGAAKLLLPENGQVPEIVGMHQIADDILRAELGFYLAQCGFHSG